MKVVNHASLYSGIGGWLLAASWAGIDNIFTCEIDEFCNKIIKKHFKVEQYHDIKETDFTKYAGRIDILSTSDPCQPFSFAGKRGGTADDRYLWPQTIRVIREVKPKFVVFENVPGLVSMAHEYKRVKAGMEDKTTYGGIYKKHFYNTWEAYIFEQIITDLEKEGYQIESFIIPACAVGAWHRRDRLWIIAYSNNSGNRTPRSGNDGHGQEKEQRRDDKSQHESCGYGKDVPNTNNSTTTRQREHGGKIHGITESKGLNDSSEGWWTTEPNVGRVAHGIPSRVDRLKSLGNSIVPQIAYLIFEAIKQYETLQ